MLSFSKSIVFLALALSTTALTTNQVRGNHHRHLARLSSPVVPLAVEEPVIVARDISARPLAMVRRSRARRDNGRCKVTSTSSAAATTSTTSTTDPAATTTAVPINNAPQPTTTTTDAPTPTDTAPPVSGPAYMTGTQSGDATYYGTGLGACGITNYDTDHIIAVSKLLFDTYPGYAGQGSNPNNNPICGKQIIASYNGNSVTVTVTDRCEACSITSLDFSPSAFSILADQALGRLHGMTWVWK